MAMFIDLTEEEARLVYMRWQNQCLILKKSGDYPEEKRDAAINTKLFNLYYDLKKERLITITN